MRTHVATIAVLVAAASLLVAPAGAVADLRPDLQPFEASDLSLESDAAGRTLLRFSTESWNHGTGPLELFVREADVPVDGKQKVYQRVFLDDGSSRERLAGEFAFHDGHDHFHFEGYARYELRGVENNGLAEGSKTSFCLLDTDRVDHKLEGAPKRPVYRQCNPDVQGISVGWGDTYGSHLPGQALDVTGLPAGEYRLIIRVDPQNRLLEADEAESDGAITNASADNVSELRIYLDASAGIVQVLDGGTDGPGNGRGGGNGRGNGPPR